MTTLLEDFLASIAAYLLIKAAKWAINELTVRWNTQDLDAELEEFTA